MPALLTRKSRPRPWRRGVRVSSRDWMEGSESTVRGRVSMPWAERLVREEGERAVAKTRRLAAWNARARE
jgi:hypothetical protein